MAAQLGTLGGSQLAQPQQVQVGGTNANWAQPQQQSAGAQSANDLGQINQLQSTAPSWSDPPAAAGGFQTPGWQYGIGQQGSIQGNVNDPGANTQAIEAARMPVSSIQQGQPYYDRMQDAYYNQARARLDPRFEQQQSGLENQLANMGLTRGSEA